MNNLFKNFCNKSKENWGVSQRYLDVALPSTNCKDNLCENNKVARIKINKKKYSIVLTIKFMLKEITIGHVHNLNYLINLR